MTSEEASRYKILQQVQLEARQKYQAEHLKSELMEPMLEQIIYRQQHQQTVMLSKSSVSFAIQTVGGSTCVIPLAKSVETFESASNSVVLSAAAYICWKFPSLPHPWYPDNTDLPIGKAEPNHVNPNLSVHPLFEAWCDILCESILQGDAVRQKDELFIILRVPASFMANLQGMEAYTLGEQINCTPEVVFSLEEIELSDRKIALMNLATSQLRDDQLAPKINVVGLILGTFFDNQKWTRYLVLKGQIPTKEELSAFDSIILPGSSFSVSDSVPEIELLSQNLDSAIKQNPNLKVLGICFGHQLISKLYNALIVRKPRIQGPENVQFVAEVVEKHHFLEPLKEDIQSDWIISEHHQDFVQEVPEGFELLSRSQSCKTEGMVSTSGNILTFQFHPEYLADYAVAYEKRMTNANSQFHMSFNLAVSQENKKDHLRACTKVRQCIAEFLA